MGGGDWGRTEYTDGRRMKDEGSKQPLGLV